MNIRRVIQRRIRSQQSGVNAVGDVHGVISANVGNAGSSSHVSSRQRSRIVQRAGRTEIHEEHEIAEGGGDRGRDL